VTRPGFWFGLPSSTLNVDWEIPIIIFLVDYNPQSKLFAKSQFELAELPFSGQVHIFHGGFALWEERLLRQTE
jgi:hypothetical protein